MPIVNGILLVFALVFLVLAAFKITTPKVDLGWLGLACWMLAAVLGLIPH